MSDSQIGPYPIERELGRGGMGVVYLGRDTKLDRSVAIKVLPDSMAADRERLARFEREAKLLASVSHPNIASIYGIEEDGARRYLVLEFVDGENLSTRLDRGPLPIDEALEACRQIAAALETAHENGVIHRDLKPGNVRMTPQGEAKVLDFGLAKGDTVSESNPDLSQSPTMTYAATSAGVILGTAGYMSPEQARGKPVDRRTDIWSFGCVLFECLTGRQAFQGETVSDTIAKILQGEPDWNLLPAKTPAPVTRLLKRCFEKDARRRLRDIGDARVELEEAIAAGVSGARTAAQEAAVRGAQRGPLVRGIAIGALAALAVAAAFVFTVGRPMLGGGGSDRVARVSVAVPRDLELFSIGLGLKVPMDLTPDGSAMVITAQPRAGGDVQLYVRTFDDAAFRPLEGASRITGAPIVSADGRFVFFLTSPLGASRPQLAKVPVDGSAAPTILPEYPTGLWTFVPLPSGELLWFSRDGRRYGKLSEGGAEVMPMRRIDGGDFTGTFDLDATGHSGILDDRTVLVGTTHFSASGWNKGIAVFDPETGEARVILDEGGNARYLDSGHLLFTRGENILVAPFDRGKLELSGEPFTVMSGIRTAGEYVPGSFHIAGGALVYAPGGKVAEQRSLVIVDEHNHIRPWSEELKSFNRAWQPAISGDQRTFAVVATNARGIDDIWATSVEQPFLRRVVSSSVADYGSPKLSHDGHMIAYRRAANDELDGIYVRELDGSGEGVRVYQPDSTNRSFFPQSWSPDGSALLVTTRAEGRWVVGLVRLRPSGGQESGYRPLIRGDHDNRSARFSPDGRHLLFQSNRTGRWQYFVCVLRSDGSIGPAVPVTRGGFAAHWTNDGRSIHFIDTTAVKSVRIATSPRIQGSAPVRHRDLDGLRIAAGEFMNNGNSFAIRQSDTEIEIDRLEVVLNWERELAERLRGSE